MLLRTKRLQSLLQEILFDPHGCESNTKSPLNVHTDCRKVSVALALSEFHDCFSNRLGELCWGSETRGSPSTAMLSGIPAALASLNLCTHRATVARPQPTVFAIPRCVVPCSHSAMILVRVTCRVVGPNGERWFVIGVESRIPRAFNTCFRISCERTMGPTKIVE